MKLHRIDWAWQEGSVNQAVEHFELRYGSVHEASWNEWLPVVLVGPPTKHIFVVQFLIAAKDSQQQKIIQQVRNELDFYLVNLGERNPWVYAKYHCNTAANVYSHVHWSCFPKR